MKISSTGKEPVKIVRQRLQSAVVGHNVIVVKVKLKVGGFSHSDPECKICYLLAPVPECENVSSQRARANHKIGAHR
ncbi:hypothetical protein D3C87_2069730 [compost metagenome]